MRRSAVLLFLIAGIVALGFGQAMDFTQPADTVPAAELGAVAVDERLQLAVADGQYPVTPGDVYGLSFLQGIEMVTSQLHPVSLGSEAIAF